MTGAGALGLPLTFAPAGRTRVSQDGERMRERIIQVLFTAPGERVNRPDFGCGLFKLVFEPNNEILAAATEFTIGQALTRWLGDELIVDAVRVEAQGELASVEIAWVAKSDLSRHAARIQFS
jgi:phage baseplate assembly protein W